MRLILAAPIAVFVLAACAPKKTSVPTPVNVVQKRAAPFATPPPPSNPKHKASAGRVTFSGLSEAELESIRVIPEQGKQLFRPANRTYGQVDGFWWKGERNAWFKIPDLSEAWVGVSPEKYDGTAHRSGLQIYQTSSSVIQALGRLSGRVVTPSWVPDAGGTRSPVARPFDWK
jgi:hypothetical protein